MSNRIFDNMRDWLAHLAATDRVAVMRDNVSLEFELAAIAKRLEGRKAAVVTHTGRHASQDGSAGMANRAWTTETRAVLGGETLPHGRTAGE